MGRKGGTRRNQAGSAGCLILVVPVAVILAALWVLGSLHERGILLPLVLVGLAGASFVWAGRKYYADKRRAELEAQQQQDAAAQAAAAHSYQRMQYAAAAPVAQFAAAPVAPYPPAPAHPAAWSPPPVYVPAAYARPAGAFIPAVPAPRPFLQQRAPAPALGPTAELRFYGQQEWLNVAGRLIHAPLTYVATGPVRRPDASAILMSLPVGTAAYAERLPYWPQYVDATPDQRAFYLDWMASGRGDPTVPLGYVFIFFYGLERRVLIEDLDEQVVRDEVVRLMGIYGHISRSFLRYASDFLAFMPIRTADRLARMSEDEVSERFRPSLESSATAQAAVAAWYFLRKKPLPAHHAARIASGMEEAKRGAVVTRSAVELLDLFSMRYRASFGDGILLEAQKRPLAIPYQPASPTLMNVRQSLVAQLPDVLGRTSQFKKVVALWNDCVEDLRKANAKKKGLKQLDAEAWTALPDELRAEYDHPDQDRWDEAIHQKPVLAGFHLVQAKELAKLMGASSSQKLTAAFMKKVAARAADVGYAVEPDARVHSKALDPEAELLVWRSAGAAAPDPKLYGAVTVIVSLAMSIAMADGVLTQEEHDVVNAFLTEVFALDEATRIRVEAMKQLMAREPSKLGAVAKKLRASRTAEELTKLGGVLVAIAAADGTIHEAEEKALRALYKNLGLSPSALTAAIARAGGKLARDAEIEVVPAAPGSRGVPIPPPPGVATGLSLDHDAIAAIVADTKEVAAILADVFDDDEDEAPSQKATAAKPKAAAPKASEAITALAVALDVRYHAVLEELLAKESWAADEVKALAARHHLMPGAVLDTINAWSDDALGDFLIEDSGSWAVNRDLAKVTT